MNTIESPYNKTNVLITGKDIERILFKYGIQVKITNIPIYQQAFVTDAYTKSAYTEAQLSEFTKAPNCVDLQERSYQIKECLGDAVLKVCMVEYIIDRYPDPMIHNEGFITQLKARLENTSSLAEFAKKLGLEQYMLITLQTENNNGRDSEKLLEDIFEAFIGALYKDQGFTIVRKLVRKILETEVDYSEILSEDTNYMKRLLIFYHSNKWSHPQYEDIHEEKKGTKFYFTVCVLDFEGKRIESTIVTLCNKKKAKQEASRLALIHYGVITD